MFKMNKTNEYNYVPNQVNIRIWDIHFASYPTTSESVSVSELKYGKKYYPNPIPYVSDPIPSLRTSYRPLDSDGPLLGAGLLEVAPRGRALTQPLGVAPHSAAPHQVSFMHDTWSY